MSQPSDLDLITTEELKRQKGALLDEIVAARQKVVQISDATHKRLSKLHRIEAELAMRESAPSLPLMRCG